jgi:hypothetical protein
LRVETPARGRDSQVSRKSPQERKALSYVRDRRNDYGENDKSSRKNIPRGKRRASRTSRRRENQILGQAAGPASNAELVERTETRVVGQKRAVFRKYEDAPLGEIVARTLRRRVEEGFEDQHRADTLIERIGRRIRRGPARRHDAGA